LIVCKSAVDCLKSLRVVLLSQDRQWEGTFTCILLPSDIATVFVPYSKQEQEGLFFYVEEFSNAGVFGRFAR
jgi:hypothetical protein